MTLRCPAFAWLQAGIPLTLLLDLEDPRGPDSHDILATERARRPLRTRPERNVPVVGLPG